MNLEINPAEYHSQLKCNRENVLSPDSWLSKSVLWELHQSSLYSWRYHPKTITPTDSMRWGSLVDCLTTSPECFKQSFEFNPYPDYRTKEAREWRDTVLANGKTIISEDELEQARNASRMLTETHKGSASIFAKSKGQVIVGGKTHGAQVKGLIDLVPDGKPYLADLKTTGDFSERGFESKSAAFGYHVQAGLYLALWNSMFPDDQRDGFKLIWQDNKAPYEVAVTTILDDHIKLGRKLAMHLIKRLVEATKADCWPMRYEEERLLMLPTYAAMEQESLLME